MSRYDTGCNSNQLATFEAFDMTWAGVLIADWESLPTTASTLFFIFGGACTKYAPCLDAKIAQCWNSWHIPSVPSAEGGRVDYRQRSSR